jgi:hypothetical protein
MKRVGVRELSGQVGAQRIAQPEDSGESLKSLQFRPVSLDPHRTDTTRATENTLESPRQGTHLANAVRKTGGVLRMQNTITT